MQGEGRMEKASRLWLSLNRKIDRIWEDPEPECGCGEDLRQECGKGADVSEPQVRKRPRGARFAAFLKRRRWELLFVAAMGCLLFVLSWILPFNEGPDEKLRYLIPTYIYHHGTLPVGSDPEIRSKLWGLSYGFQPITPYIFAGYLMRLVGLFNSSEKALLMTARFVNILIGMGFYWFVALISERLFPRRKLFRTFFVALLALLPQLLYLFVYVNMDGTAVFSGAMLIWCWLEGMDRCWDRRSCTWLAVGVAVCVLSYYNAYGYALFSVVLFVGSLIGAYACRGAKRCMQVILKRGIYITVLVLVLSGWWFVRSAVLYDGDFLGLDASDRCAEQYAQEEFRPSVRKSVAQQGVPLGQMLRTDNGGMEWIRSTYCSTIGQFGYAKYYLGLDIYEVHLKLFAMGMIGLFLAVLFRLLRRPAAAGARILGRLGRKLPEPRGPWEDSACETGSGRGRGPAVNFFLLQISFVCCIIIPVALSVYYSYTIDFQAQGRYIMPMIVPMAYFITVGIEKFLTLFFRRWMVCILMIPLFYAVLHVFLSAFVSVYVPTFVESLSAWSQIRFPWFMDSSMVNRLLYLLIPG